MKKHTLRKIKDKKGITLIALVITIIILVILAGITILQLTGNGLLKKVTEIKETTKIKEAEEEMQMKIMEIQSENNGKATYAQLVEKLKEDNDNTYIINETYDEKDSIYITNIKKGCEIELKNENNTLIIVGSSISSGSSSSGNSDSEGENNKQYSQTNEYAYITDKGIMNKKFVNVEDESDYYFESDLDESFLEEDALTREAYDNNMETYYPGGNVIYSYLNIDPSAWGLTLKFSYLGGYHALDCYDLNNERMYNWLYSSRSSDVEFTIPENSIKLIVYFNEGGGLCEIKIDNE